MMNAVMKKVLAVVAALAVAVLIAVPTAAHAAGTGTITITPPTDTPANTTNTYKIYKIFEADGNGTNISYKLPSGKSLTEDMATYFDVDSAGNVTVKDAAKNAQGELTSNAINAIKSWLNITDSTTADYTATSTGTANATVSNVANGYYYITTSNGSAVTITSTNPDATVNDKNTIPNVDKKITGVGTGSVDSGGQKAIAQVGTTVSYQSDVTVYNTTTNLEFTDAMGQGLSYNSETANLTVKVGDATATKDTDYTVTSTTSGFTIKFNDSYISGLSSSPATINISYSATITSDALTKDAAKNTASIKYGDPNTNTRSSTHQPEVYNAKYTVTKVDGNNQALAGAGFVIKNASNKYYKKDDNNVSWVDSESDATELTTTSDSNVVTFTGLANGTYTLVEKTVPSGYNKAADVSFEVKSGDYSTTNLEQSTIITNNAGSAMPSTGDIGTRILYAVGILLIIAGAGYLIARRRMQKN